ncbi:MAG: methionine--tRNA ligase [Patescibacteria group bacterium]|jgi:methionyl-tRNA synthetase
MAKNIFISTSIPYVNASPHIGHALEFVQADTLARFYRLSGQDVFFLSGTDENAQKNVASAEKEGIYPQALVDKYSQAFYKFKPSLNISFDDFLRTTEKRHKLGAQRFWELCRSDIYKKKYKGWYCAGCEAFVTEKDLVDGLCPEHHKKPVLIEEENYFFNLSKYQKQIEELIENDTIKIFPEERKNEVLSFIRRGLEDFSVSRSAQRVKNWGIPVPGDPSQIIYVWFDALLNYITALNFGTDQKLYKKYWENGSKIHVIGKGISRFHAIYWPAMLLSAKLPLPTEEFIHGYVTVNGEKISKSLGNVIDPFEVVKKYGTDPVRYYLLKEINPFKDGDFSFSRFEELYNSDLANGLGNLIQRVARLCEKNSVIIEEKEFPIDIRISQTLTKFEFHLALEAIWNKITEADRLVDSRKPWELTGDEAIEILTSLGQKIREVAYNLRPFLPETSEKILQVFSGAVKTPAKPFFPRIK